MIHSIKNSEKEVLITHNILGIDKKDLKITHEKLLELALSEDLPQIEKDWNLIIQKIRNGQAHEISEADTMYLGACSKGANSLSLRKQPFNDIPAMQRAFRAAIVRILYWPRWRIGIPIALRGRRSSTAGRLYILTTLSPCWTAV